MQGTRRASATLAQDAPVVLRFVGVGGDDDVAAIEFILDKLKETKTNEEFLNSMKR